MERFEWSTDPGLKHFIEFNSIEARISDPKYAKEAFVSTEMKQLCDHYKVIGSFYMLGSSQDIFDKYIAFQEAKHPLFFKVDMLGYDDVTQIDTAEVITNVMKMWLYSYKIRETMGEDPFYDLNVYMTHLVPGSIVHKALFKGYWTIVMNRICDAYNEYPTLYHAVAIYPRYYHPFTPEEWCRLTIICDGPKGLYALFPDSMKWHTGDEIENYNTNWVNADECREYTGSKRRGKDGWFNREVSTLWNVRAKINGKQNHAKNIWLPQLLWRMCNGPIPSTHSLQRDMNYCSLKEDQCCINLACYCLVPKQKRQKT